ncbi:MAG: superoxide dismutase family protein [Acidobacteriota bacterium]
MRKVGVVLALSVAAPGVQAHENHSGLAGSVELAQAVIRPLGKSGVHGLATFRPANDGLEITIQAVGLTPGRHGFHIHQWGDCSKPDGSGAGDHFDPDAKAEHGVPGAASCHAGDFGNLIADQTGVAVTRFVAHGLSLGGGKSCILGRSIVLHDEEDKGTAAAKGGARIACGVIEEHANPTPPVLPPTTPPTIERPPSAAPSNPATPATATGGRPGR